MLPVHTKRYRRFKTNSFATVPQPDYKPPAVERTVRTPPTSTWPLLLMSSTSDVTHRRLWGGIKRLTWKDRQVPGGHRLPPFVGAICPRGKSKAKNPGNISKFQTEKLLLARKQGIPRCTFWTKSMKSSGDWTLHRCTMKVTWIWVCLAGSEEFYGLATLNY